ncbi:MAG: hypothetical protein ABSA63_09245 [Thermoplasmata archaeon]|jgi:translation initiation factor 2B subunit (eIF-2B alpha/beta/delta family)
MSVARSRRGTHPRGRGGVAFEGIRTDRTHGARFLGAEALTALARAVNSWSSLSDAALPDAIRTAARDLEQTQPAMGPFLRWANDLRGIARSDARRNPLGRVRSWIRRERACLREERHGLVRTSRGRFPRARLVVTLSRSQSVLWALEAAPGSRRPGRVAVLESLPGGEGRVFAKALRERGLSARVIPDAQGIAAVVTADLLIIGADAVFSDGSVVHKVGTRALARAAFRSGVPVVVVAGRSKFAHRRPPHRALPSMFDRTPARYVTEFWTDQGVRRGGVQRSRRPRRTSL